MLKNQVLKKIVMSVSGFAMTAFVILHLLGNTTIFAGPDGINEYAKTLHRFGGIIWVLRLFLAGAFSLHVFFGISLKLENRAAKSTRYAVKEYITSTFAGRNAVWTGLLIGAFLGFHLLHFTLQVILPEYSAAVHADAGGRPDVFMMVVGGFSNLSVAGLYLCGLGALGLHLMHGIQSAFQTIGMNSERTFPLIVRGGLIAAALIFLGFASFPITIFSGLLK